MKDVQGPHVVPRGNVIRSQNAAETRLYWLLSRMATPSWHLAHRKLKNKTPKVVSDELRKYANAREHAGTLTNKSEGLILTENFRLLYVPVQTMWWRKLGRLATYTRAGKTIDF